MRQIDKKIILANIHIKYCIVFLFLFFIFYFLFLFFYICFGLWFKKVISPQPLTSQESN